MGYAIIYERLRIQEIDLNNQRAKAIDNAIKSASSFDHPDRKLSMREVSERLKARFGIEVSINAIQKWRKTGNIRKEVIGPLCEILNLEAGEILSLCDEYEVDLLDLVNDIKCLRSDQKYALRILVSSMLEKA